jgi:hypothetical protein
MRSGSHRGPPRWSRDEVLDRCPAKLEDELAAGGAGAAAMQTVYLGPWDDIWHAHAALLARIARKSYEVGGPVRDLLPRATM